MGGCTVLNQPILAFNITRSKMDWSTGTSKPSNILIELGGSTVQRFLKEDVIDEMIVTVLPIMLEGGSPPFGELAEPMQFEHVKTEVIFEAIGSESLSTT